MCQLESPFAWDKFTTTGRLLNSFEVKAIWEEFAENSLKTDRNALLSKPLAGATFIVVPIIDHYHSDGVLIFRLFTINAEIDSTITEEEFLFGYSFSPISSFDDPQLNVFHSVDFGTSTYNDIIIFDVKEDVDRIFIGIRQAEDEPDYYISDRKVKLEKMFIQFEFPIRRVERPDTFEQLIDSSFLGLSQKEYISDDEIGFILRSYVRYLWSWDYPKLKTWLLLLSLVFGFWVILLPLYFQRRSKAKRQFTERLQLLKLSDNELQNPSDEWLEAVTLARDQYKN